MPKRKAKELDNGAHDTPDPPSRRSSRKTPSAKSEAASAKATTPAAAPAPKKTKKAAKGSSDKDLTPNGVKEENPEAKPKSANKEKKSAPQSAPSDQKGRQYWLMKAEPESRLEKGHDVKFSIDDLAAKNEPEPWDGIRNYAARNNIRSMKKGDLAFFYHSSCKIPAIVGIMEIVQEHSPDLSAHDPSAPYHDPSSNPENPKWSVVHVTFRQKLGTPITLKEMKEWQGENGHPLENMQMLRMTRMSVSKVSSDEWDFLVGEMKKNNDVVEQ